MIVMEDSILRINSVVLYALLFTLAGCAEQPSEELEAARKAVETAREIGADVYAGSEFRNASSVLKEAEAEIAVQDESFALGRSYDKAIELLNTASAQAETAISAAAVNKTKVKGQAEAAKTEAKAALNQAEASLTKAPRGKGSQADVAALEADVASAQASISEAERNYQGGKYKKALDGFTSAKARSEGVNNEIQQAIEQRRR